MHALFFAALYALSFAGLRRYQRETVGPLARSRAQGRVNPLGFRGLVFRVESSPSRSRASGDTSARPSPPSRAREVPENLVPEIWILKTSGSCEDKVRVEGVVLSA